MLNLKSLFISILYLSINTVQADFIVKYKNGKVETSALNPAEVFGAMALDSGDDQIEYIEEDTILRAHAISSSDPLFSQQWALSNYNSYSFERAKSLASSSVNVAIVDTGITSHSDLSANIIQGADLISSPSNARDGNGRDSNPEDLGDYAQGSGCSGNSNSTWHGTHIAGIIGAVSNNGIGVAGASTNVRMMPLRVLGPCGGNTSDIADAIKWAVGGSISGLSNNANPAKVINLSLGGKAACSRYMQEAIDYANARDAVIVVSSGNESDSVDSMEYTPANCRGVLRVGAIDSNHYQSYYSNYGQIIDISAPGDVIYSTLNSGSSTQASQSYGTMSGTSMSAGFISAAAALIFSVNSNLTGEQVKDILTRNSSYIYCRNSNCSAGSVDPYEAALDAQSESRDESFTYNDPLVVGGYKSISSNLNQSSSDNSGGGFCGSVEFVDGNKSDSGHKNFLFVFFLMVLIVAASYKKQKIKQQL